jgi:hypothetical protein
LKTDDSGLSCFIRTQTRLVVLDHAEMAMPRDFPLFGAELLSVELQLRVNALQKGRFVAIARTGGSWPED